MLLSLIKFSSFFLRNEKKNVFGFVFEVLKYSENACKYIQCVLFF